MESLRYTTHNMREYVGKMGAISGTSCFCSMVMPVDVLLRLLCGESPGERNNEANKKPTGKEVHNRYACYVGVASKNRNNGRDEVEKDAKNKPQRIKNRQPDMLLIREAVAVSQHDKQTDADSRSKDKKEKRDCESRPGRVRAVAASYRCRISKVFKRGFPHWPRRRR